MKKLLKNKKVLVAAALATILAIGGATYAWFTNAQTVAGGDLEMGIIEVSVSELQQLKWDTSVSPPVLNMLDFDGTIRYLPDSETTLGYSATLAGNSDSAIVYLDLANTAMINFATSQWSYPYENAYWAGPDNALPPLSLYDFANDDTYAGHGTISVTPDLSLLASADGLTTYFYDEANNVLFALMDPGAETTDIQFTVKFSDDLTNTFQNCTVKFSELGVLAAQCDEEWKAIDGLLESRGIDYSFAEALINNQFTVY